MNIPGTSWKIAFNSPVILIFSLICVLVYLSTFVFGNTVISLLNAHSGVDVFSPWFYVGLVAHPFAHMEWKHLMGNLTFLLLLGPILEEKHGRTKLVIVILATAIVTGLVNAAIFNNGIYGASGIVFMFILLASFTGVNDHEIPLTFLFVALLYIGQEVVNSFKPDGVSQFAHIIGGVSGSIFGFIYNGKKRSN